MVKQKLLSIRPFLKKDLGVSIWFFLNFGCQAMKCQLPFLFFFFFFTNELFRKRTSFLWPCSPIHFGSFPSEWIRQIQRCLCGFLPTWRTLYPSIQWPNWSVSYRLGQDDAITRSILSNAGSRYPQQFSVPPSSFYTPIPCLSLWRCNLYSILAAGQTAFTTRYRHYIARDTSISILWRQYNDNGALFWNDGGSSGHGCGAGDWIDDSALPLVPNARLEQAQCGVS